MKPAALFSVLLFVGCSHVTTAPRVVLELPFAPELVQEMQAQVARVPASLEVSEVEGKSPRRVYFTALYHQYLTLSNHLNETPDLQSCPQFHHDKIETDASRIPEFSVFKSFKGSPSEIGFFPEVAFTKRFSLKDHHQTIRSEIDVLCEEGLSDNFYKFDNLVTHYAVKKSFHSHPDAMKSVLKIPVFANYYLLKMLQGPHAIGVTHPEEQKIISLTQTHWFEMYVVEAHRQRSNLIKNRMVQR